MTETTTGRRMASSLLLERDLKWSFLGAVKEDFPTEQIWFMETQILTILRRAESGMPVPELCREYGISKATFYGRVAKSGRACAPSREPSAR